MIPKKILFCTDFSDNSRPALEYAVDYAKVFGAELMVLHIINSSQIGYPSLEEGVPVDIRSALDSIQQSVSKALELITKECSEIAQSKYTHACRKSSLRDSQIRG